MNLMKILIDEAALLYGLNHINTVCNQMDRL